MSNTPVELVLSKLPDAKRAGKSWSARCPAHDDRRPSLSIAEGDDGRALIRCHAGCSVAAIVAALGLGLADLMPAGCVDVDGNRRRPSKPAFPSTAARSPKTYPTARAAVAELERRHGKRSGLWTYRNAHGEPVGAIVRWDTPDGKDIRPVSRHGDGWIIGGMPEPRPLYRLPDLADAKQVYVVEGEPAAEAARSLGLTATTSPHGSKSPGKADWSPLAGKDVVILPDNDLPGRSYADAVAAILGRLKPAPTVKVVDLPDLPEHGDIADWVAAHPDVDPSELRRQVEALVGDPQALETLELMKPEPAMMPWKPFPVDALPEPVRGFVADGSAAIGCDPAYVALPLLSALAAAIGNTRRIRLKRGWDEPAILWTAIVGDSGTMKSPALELALQPVRERQRKALTEHGQRMAEYRDALLRYERDLAQWKRSKGGEDPPDKPEEPIADRCWCDDPTIEALAVLLQQNWRGLLMVRDELSGWIAGFDRYSQGKGGDVARWLEMFGGRLMVVDRKTGNPKTLYVPRAAVSVAGGIQPEILRRYLGQQYRDNGLAARLLLAWPPRRAKRWTEADIAPEAEAAIALILDRLYGLQPVFDADEDPRPAIVRLTPEGKREWIRFFDQHAQEHVELTGDLSAAWSKLEGGAARLALVVHLTRWAAGDPRLTTPEAVDAVSIAAGVRLSRWFGHEARRVYAMLDETEEARDRRRLVELVRRKGGSVTARDLMRSSRKYPTAAGAEGALDDLVKAGIGSWQEDDHGGGRGRPVRRFVLSDVDTNTADAEENRISVNVNAVNGDQVNDLLAEAGADDSDDWGAI
jgi:hypothetical protein